MPPSDFLVVNTDLDATLLDHDTYSWAPAQEALTALQEREVPLILNSSKTLAEMQVIAEELQSNAPLVCENGAFLAIPQSGEFSLAEISATFPEVEEEGSYWLCHLGVSRAHLLPIIAQLRGTTEEYVFQGYADWSVDEVAAHTGLPPEKAALSKQRNGTEPIHWHGTEEAYAQFVSELAQHELKAVVGGRFIHLSGQSDKARGLEALHQLYQSRYPERKVVSIALGDSPNDLGMLNAADIAVVIPNHTPLSPSAPMTIYAKNQGPVGWNAEILNILAQEPSNLGK